MEESEIMLLIGIFITLVYIIYSFIQKNEFISQLKDPYEMMHKESILVEIDPDGGKNNKGRVDLEVCDEEHIKKMEE